MIELLERYHTVTIADLYRLVGQTPNYTDDRWGWDDLSSADYRRVRDGHHLLLPEPKALD